MLILISKSRKSIFLSKCANNTNHVLDYITPERQYSRMWAVCYASYFKSHNSHDFKSQILNLLMKKKSWEHGGFSEIIEIVFVFKIQ